MTFAISLICVGLAIRIIRARREKSRLVAEVEKLRAARHRTALRMWSLREGRNVARYCAIQFHEERNELLRERGEIEPVKADEMWRIN